MITLYLSKSAKHTDDSEHYFLTSFGADYVDLLNNNLAQESILECQIGKNRVVEMKYLNRFTGLIIGDLAIFLNALHASALSIRYWETLIGHLTSNFIVNAYFYWKQYEYLFSKTAPGTKVKFVTDKKTEYTVPNDLAGYLSMSVEEEYQSFLASVILSKFCDYELNGYNSSIVATDKEAPGKKRRSVMFFFNDISTYVYSRVNSIHFYQIVPFFKFEYFRMHIACGQIPLPFFSRDSPHVESEEDLSVLRKTYLISGSGSVNTPFEHFVRENILGILPKQLIEDYKGYCKASLKLYGKKKPEFIVVSNLIAPVLFLEHIACAAETGSKVILLQHGGAYGILEKFWQQDHDIFCSDIYGSWGWTLKDQKRVVKAASFRMALLKNEKKVPHKKGLVVYTLTNPKIPYEIISSYIGPDDISYLKGIKIFSETLLLPIKKEVTVRMHPGFLDHSEIACWQSFFPDSVVDYRNINGFSLMLSANLIVITYNATVILEAFVLNIPVVAFWDFEILIMTPEAREAHQGLIDAKVLFTDPQEAAFHINNVYNNIEDWWFSEMVQSAVSEFKKTYANEESPLLHLKNIIKQLS